MGGGEGMVPGAGVAKEAFAKPNFPSLPWKPSRGLLGLVPAALLGQTQKGPLGRLGSTWDKGTNVPLPQIDFWLAQL